MWNTVRRTWRRTGCDLPFGDPLPSHGAHMEGYLWRFTDPPRRRVLVVACGVNRHADGPWGTVVLAAEPGGTVVSATDDHAWSHPDRHQVRAGRTLRYEDGRLTADLGRKASLDVRLAATRAWPRRALHGSGVFSLVPGLNHYWHPYLFDARVTGWARVGADVWDLSGCHVYAEKSWGRGFPTAWWWGQAHGFDREDVCVAFAGGHLALGPFETAVNGVVVRLGSRVLRLVPPLAVVHGASDGTGWHLRARDARYRVRVEGRGDGARPLLLPVPVPRERRHARSRQHLTARIRLTVSRGGHLLYRGESALAGLETGGVPTSAAKR
ncbi:hypothetical protein GCM10010358_21770 [Streptomyces minutiscleroticus]|uniref:Tocopherol cyclase n=2 Tax=Streptomyces minutiscleroticus TaxID=68238 RepID=A0A918KKA9_9ACTN|nr:hypothetical protein GCM10010358_21770 [Streptomyces minutiscleroticus]